MRNKSGVLATDTYHLPRGEVEFTFRDKFGNVIGSYTEHNLVKIFAKEIISHRVGPSEVWDPDANSGAGGWVASTVDPNEDFSLKYILFGASFDENGVPLDQNDTRYYTYDSITGTYIPIRLEPSAQYEGGLINPIPIAEPDRPLKRIESVTFDPTYQPASTPLLQDDVRAVNNIVYFETTLKIDEYNGLGTSSSDFFTITEVALASGKQLDSIGACECDPHTAFLEGDSGVAMLATFSGGDVVTIDESVSQAAIDSIREGDQVKIVDVNDTAGDTITLDQVSPFYLVTSKSATGRELTLDRTPTDSTNTPLTGSCGVFRDTLRIFSHSILSVPVRKSSAIEIGVKWKIIFN